MSLEPHMIRTLICDDHPIVVAGTKDLLSSQPDIEVVGLASTGAEAVGLAATLQPDVVLMDIEMPEMNGFESMQQIKRRRPQTHVIILTLYEGQENIIEAFERGAANFLKKDVPPEALFNAVRRAAADIPPSMTPVVASTLLTQVNGSLPGSLDHREIEVVALAAKGLSNKDIAGHTYVSEDTVKWRLKNIFNKLGVQNRAAAVAEAISRGLIMPDS